MADSARTEHAATPQAGCSGVHDVHAVRTVDGGGVAPRRAPVVLAVHPCDVAMLSSVYPESGYYFLFEVRA